MCSLQYINNDVGNDMCIWQRKDHPTVHTDFALEMAAANGKQWVMLVAGSKTWSNYRHQADVCHAYQIVHQNGIPDDQIVVMMYDDIANNDHNPCPGNIINKPGGPNVYPRVPKDYTGTDVTPENFLAALKGDRQNCQKKVITSGRNDTIFIYMADHGGPGLFCFPKSSLYACDLIETIKKMASDNKFLKMVIYMESCFSGSMFNQLPENIHVYAVSAARADESSYACYWDDYRKTCLADEFSSIWMYYIEANDLKNKTFRDQFSYLQKMMTSSHSCCFGDMTTVEDPISEFLRNTPQAVQTSTKAHKLMLTNLIHSHEVAFKILEHRIDREQDDGMKQDLIRKHKALHQTKAKIEGKVKSVSERFFPGGVEDISGGDSRSAMDLFALKTVAEHFRTKCFDWHKEEFHIALSYMHDIARLLERGVKAESIIKALTEVSSEGASV